MPPAVFPFPAEIPEDEVATAQVKLILAGIVGSPDGPPPKSDPESMGLYFDLMSRVANPAAADGTPLVYQWKFSDAEPWHLILDNGSTRAEPGLAPSPTVTIESTWADWVASGKPGANPLKFIATRKIRPHGSLRELARMRKVFG